jgi:ADP-heptose:LPS heptosyltransferase
MLSSPEPVRTVLLKNLDRFLAPPACRLARLLPQSAAPTSSTLIIRPGGLGDLVCADIALQTLGLDARKFNWLIETRSQPWAEYRGLPYVCYDRQPVKMLAKIFGSHDLVINTEQLYGLSQASGLLARARGGRLVSFDTNRGAAWANRTVPYDWKDAHEVIEFARLFCFALNPSEEAFFADCSRPRTQPACVPPLVLIAGRQSRSRRLPIATWERLIATWHSQRKFLLAAAPEDAAFADELAKKFGDLATRFTGSFAQLCDQIARAEEFFTMDGGGVHIASFFGVPTFAIFTSGRDHKWEPISPGSRVLRRHDLPCQPCAKFGQVPPCPNRYACHELQNIKAAPTGK